jgi:WD40 repeat protein
VGALDVVKRGGVEVLDFLLAALSDRDTQVATAAASCVSALENRVVIDELCRRWVESRSSQLEGIIRQGGYVASQPVAVRVLTALKLNQIQEISDGGIEVLDCVLKAFDDRDMEVVRSANVCAVSLTNRGAIDELCKRWASSRNKRLEGIIRKGGYIASQPIEARVLTGLKFNQYQDVLRIGSKVLDPLLKAINDKDPEIANIAKDLSTQFRDVELINTLCKSWTDSRSKELEKIILDGGYIANEPIEVKVLSALKFNQYDKIINDGSEILDPLIKAFGDKDLQIKSNAKICITQLQNKQTIDSLCKRWIESQNPVLKPIIQKSGYEPSNSSMKAVFFFLLGEWQKYEDLDFDQSLLSKAYHSGNEVVKRQIASQAKRAGRIEWIKILTNEGSSFNIEEMTDKDWESFINILVKKPDKKEIWKFLSNSPIIWSKKLLSRLSKVSYRWFKKSEEPIVQELFHLANNFQEHDLSSIYIREPKVKLLSHDKVEKIDTLVVSHDGRFLVSGASGDCTYTHRSSSRSNNYTINIWGLPDGNHLKHIRGSVESFHSLAINSKLLVVRTGTDGDTFDIWSLPDGKLLNNFEFPSFSDNESSAISPNGRFFAFYDYDDFVNIYSLPNGNEIKAIKVSTNNTVCLTISPNSQFLIFYCDNRINIYNLEDGNYINSFKINVSSFPSLKVSNDSSFLVSKSEDKTIDLWSLPDGNHMKTIIIDNILVPHLEFKYYLNLSPNNRTLVLNNIHSNTISLWNLPSGNHIKSFQASTFSKPTISSDSKLLAFNNVKEGVHLFNLSDGNFITTLKLKSTNFAGNEIIFHPTDEIVFSPTDNKLLISAGDYGNIHLFNLSKSFISNIPINKLSDQDIEAIELKFKDFELGKNIHNAIKFSLTLIRLKQQFDIDIEDVSSDVQFSEFDIEIDG